MLEHVNDLLSSFNQRSSHGRAIFFQALLQPPIKNALPATDSLCFEVIYRLEQSKQPRRSQKIVELLELLRSKDHGSIIRFLLLRARLSEEDEGYSSNKILKSVSLFPPLPNFGSMVVDGKTDHKDERIFDGLFRTNEKLALDDSDQGFCENNTAAISFTPDELWDEFGRMRQILSWNEQLIANRPDKCWMLVPCELFIGCLVKAICGIPSFMIQKCSVPKVEFRLIDGVFVEGVSDMVIRSAVDSWIALANRLNNARALLQKVQCPFIRDEDGDYCSPMVSLLAISGIFDQQITANCQKLIAEAEKFDDVQMKSTRTDLMIFLREHKKQIEALSLACDLYAEILTESIDYTASELINRMMKKKNSWRILCPPVVALIDEQLVQLLRVVYRSFYRWVIAGCFDYNDGVFQALQLPETSSFATIATVISGPLIGRGISRDNWRLDYGARLVENCLIGKDLCSRIILAGKTRRLALDWGNHRLEQELDTTFSDSFGSELITALQYIGSQDAIELCFYSKLEPIMSDTQMTLFWSEFRQQWLEQLELLRDVYLHNRHAVTMRIVRLLQAAAGDDVDLSQEIVLNESSCNPTAIIDAINIGLADLNYSPVLTSNFKAIIGPPTSALIDTAISLQYSPKAPFDLVLSRSTLDGYSKIWMVLIRLTTAQTTLIEVAEDVYAFQDRSLANARLVMMHFIGTLQSYFITQINSIVYAKYQPLFLAVDSIDAAYHLHKKYVTELVQRCLLGVKLKRLMDDVLLRALQAVDEFRMAAREGFFDVAREQAGQFYSWFRQFNRAVQSQTKSGTMPWFEDLLVRLDLSGDNWFERSIEGLS